MWKSPWSESGKLSAESNGPPVECRVARLSNRAGEIRIRASPSGAPKTPRHEQAFTAGRAPPSSAKSFCSASFRPGSLFFSILRRCVRVERMKKPSRDTGYFVDSGHKRRFIYLRRFVEARDFSHELERSSSNIFVSDGRIEVEKGFDIPAHSVGPPFTTSTNLNFQAA